MNRNRRTFVPSLLALAYGVGSAPARADLGNLQDFSQIGLFPIAAGKVTGATGATTGKQGVVTVARTGAGVYTLTLVAGSSGINANACLISLTLRESGVIRYADTSDTVKTVSSFAVDGATATDKNFDFIIWGLPTGG